jgi:GDP-4-dehydro-6-deoxy-D-mannose reductase
MTPTRILLTGAAGFVGIHLTAALRQAFPAATLCPARVDITDAAAVEAEIASTKPDACIHLAAVAAIPRAEQDPDLAWRVNLLGTLYVARAVLQHVPDCVLLFASSADAYGQSLRSGLPIDETAALAPMNNYAATKAAADLALGAMAGRGLRVIRVRPFNHTGPGQSDEFVVPAFAKQVAAIAWGGAPAMLQVGDLTAERDFLDVRDVCAAYVACFRYAEALQPGAIVNIASGHPRQVGDVLMDLLALAGARPDIVQDPTRLRRSEIPRACGDATLARQLMGWAPAIPWQRTLRDVLEHWRQRLGA